MAHCRKEDLQDLTQLIESIRKIDGLKEKSFGCFYLKSKGIIHFHKTKGRRFVHLWNGKSWDEIDLIDQPSSKAQAFYLKQIQVSLSKSDG